MPPYWNYWTRNRRYRRRRFWTRRFRAPFRRRRRTKWRVRHRKLKKIIVKQFQPPCIKKCTIKGLWCLLMFSPERLSYNSTMYQDSIVPVHWPGGGGFSVTKISLESLYEDHLRCRNWWTNSNDNLPLCRYTGAVLKLYQCDEVDYVMKIQTQLPPHSGKLTYPSCHPSMMLMSTDKIIVPSKKTHPYKKGYKKIRIAPPPQFSTEWYFQIDMYKYALMVIYTTAVSLQNYSLRPNKRSCCITFNTLNTMLIQNRNMSIETTTSWPYKTIGTINSYMYYYHPGRESAPSDTNDIQIQNLIPLTNPRNDTPGNPYQNNSISDYFKNFNNWGNPFSFNVLEHHEDSILITNKSPEAIASAKNPPTQLQPTTKWSELDPSKTTPLTWLDEHIFNKVQYNPFKDTGKDTSVYLLPNYSGNGWDPPSNEDLILEGFPLWLILWGFADFQIKLKKYNNIQTKTILVIKTKSTFPIVHVPLVPLSDSFITGKSPYESIVLDADKTMWFPMLEYQEEEINKIVSCGPGIPYSPNYKQENINCFAKLYFKWGGSPPKHVTVENPAQQPIYPIPGNQPATISLQNPAQAPETTLYSFDFRRDYLTRAAQTRISSDWDTQNFVTSITEPTTRINLQRTLQELEAQENQQTQAEKETLLHLQQLRQYQQSLREQMFSIMKNLNL
nr:MAG: ORF1 [TTV-like mini virus]